MKQRILVLEDDSTTAKVVTSILAKNDFVVELLSTGDQLVETTEQFQPHVVILDNVPNVSCFDSCRMLKHHQFLCHLPVIVYSGRLDDTTMVSLLDMGADVVLPKSSSPRVLVALINALLRRTRRRPPLDREPLHRHEIVVSPSQKRLLIRGAEIQVTGFELDLLYLLLSTPDKIFSRNEILTYLRGQVTFESDRVVDVLVLRLRKKHPLLRRSLLSVRGKGYYFKEPNQE